MNYTIEEFKEEHKRLKLITENCENDEYVDGKLNAYNELENLILFVVIRQSEQLKKKEEMTFAEFVNEFYITNGKIYVNKKDGYSNDLDGVRLD